MDGVCRRLAGLTFRAAIAGMGVALSTQTPAAGEALKEANPAEWRLNGNSPGQLFYSPMDQINDQNVSRLGLAWSVDLPTKDGPVGNILVVDGIAYESASGGRVYAVDLRAARLLWKFEPQIRYAGSALATFDGARALRGLALEGDKVFVNLPDCRIVALDKNTGDKLWDTVSCDRSAGYTQTGVPLIAHDLVIVGNSCMDMGGIRGFITARDQATGHEKWRFYVVPQYPHEPAGGQATPALEMAAKTWGTNPPQAQVGCGGSYGGMTYDPVTNLVFVSTSGADPWSPAARAEDAGDELFAGSIVALRPDTGEYVWHYKLAPNDGWNWEAFQNLVADVTIEGHQRRVLMNAPKHGYLITLDAETGEFISAVKAAGVNWAEGFDANGRPILTGVANYWQEGRKDVVALPGPSGSHNWQAMSYSPKTGLIYIPEGNLPSRMVADDSIAVGGATLESFYEDEQYQHSGLLVAIDPSRQKIRWQIEQEFTYNGGVLSTAGNLVFQGTGRGYLEVRAADTGELLWSRYLGGSLLGAPSTVMLDGEQYVLLPSGNANSAGIAMSESQLTSCDDCRQAPSRILAFKLGGDKTLPPNPKLPPIAEPPLPRFDEKLAAKGESFYAANGCELCHGIQMVHGGGTARDLHRTSEAFHKRFDEIVRGGMLNSIGMPRFSYLSDDDLKALQAYIVNNAWDAYEAQEAEGGMPR